MPSHIQPKAMAPMMPPTICVWWDTAGSPDAGADKIHHCTSTNPIKPKAQCMNVGPIKAEARREYLFMKGLCSE